MTFYTKSVIDPNAIKMIIYTRIDAINLGGMILQNGNKIQQFSCSYLWESR